MNTSRALVLHHFGTPPSLEVWEPEDAGRGDVSAARVRGLLAPINPADLNVIEGKYATLPSLPAVLGMEGVGIVETPGSGPASLPIGTRVLLPMGFGTWRESGWAQAEDLVAVPDGISDTQAAMLRVNPATALRMLRDFVVLSPGEWIIQNGANSAVGRAVIEIAKACGWRTVNIVRRPEVVDELRDLGADVVLVESEDLRERVESVCDGAPVRLALNAVGGDSALRMAGALGTGGVLVTYGAMGRQPLRIPNGLLIFKDVSFRGFWISRWYRDAAPATRASFFDELFTLSRRGCFETPVAATFPLAQSRDALSLAAQGARGGKVLFSLQS